MILIPLKILSAILNMTIEYLEERKAIKDHKKKLQQRPPCEVITINRKKAGL